MSTNTYLKSPLNYTGGKKRLLPQLLPLFPTQICTFVDLFCGGGNVGINVKADNYIYNDKDKSVIGLLRMFKQFDYDQISDRINKIIKEYALSDSSQYGYNYYGCNSSNGLGPYNKAKYNNLREHFNHLAESDPQYFIILYTLIIYAFNNQIRFNNRGGFNLPVGKRDFNLTLQRNLQKFIAAFHSQNLQLLNSDFRHINMNYFGKEDFFYCDPPYLITTAAYNEKNGWTEQDERDLYSYLDELNTRHIPFALSNVLVHKGRSNKILKDWSINYNVHLLNYSYVNSNYHADNRDKITQEVLVTNY